MNLYHFFSCCFIFISGKNYYVLASQKSTYPSPSEGASEIISGAQRKDTDCRNWLEWRLDLVQDGKDPADGAVASARQDPQIGRLPEHVQAARKGKGIQ